MLLTPCLLGLGATLFNSYVEPLINTHINRTITTMIGQLIMQLIYFISLAVKPNFE